MSAAAKKLVESKAQEIFPNDPTSQRYFVALAQQESGFDPNAVPPGNPVDVHGLFQFGPELRKKYGLTPDSSPEEQVNAAGDYIKGLSDKYVGNWTKILGEHYLGEPRFKKMQQGVHDAETRSFYLKHLPAVTRIAEAGAPSDSALEDVATASSPQALAAAPSAQPPQLSAPSTVAATPPDLSSLLPQPVAPPDPRRTLLLSMLANQNPQLSPILQLLAMRQKAGVA